MRALAPSLLACACAVPLAAARAQAPDVAVRAVSEYAVARAGDAFRVAVRLDVPEGWHIGWINPGASGLPTTLAWRLPDGVSGGATDWPYPETDESGADVLNVYRGTVIVFSTFHTTAGLHGAATLSGDLSWGICRGVCIQQHRTVSVALRVTGEGGPRAPAWAEDEAATRRLPMREHGAAFEATRAGDGIRLTITGLKAGPAAGSWATFFPAAGGRASVVSRVQAAAGGIAVTLPGAVVADTATALVGVLVAAHPPGAPPPVRAIAVDTPLHR